MVLAVVGAAILVLDSPAEERRERIDERRVEELRTIADGVEAYWRREEEFPVDLEALDGWQGIEIPLEDPANGESYGYRPTGERSYELCAVFDREAFDGDLRRYPRYHHRWHHPAGEHCFELRVAEDGE